MKTWTYSTEPVTLVRYAAVPEDIETSDETITQPTQIGEIKAPPLGAPWVRYVASYQSYPDVGYATLEDLAAHHAWVDSEALVDWVDAGPAIADEEG